MPAMLSRVAENTYWMARYVERAENTARLINVTANLLLDLPAKIHFGWEALIEITGYEDLFQSTHQTADERTVVRFLLADGACPGSVLSSLRAARENARTIRETIPREAWEQVNHLYWKSSNDLQFGLSQRGRHDYLRWLILGAQTITGMLAGTMTHDEAYAFLRMGRNLERADMTTRIIDVRSADLLAAHGADLVPFDNIQWMSVLKSLTAYQMYRREMQVQVRRPEVLAFLLQNRRFPRALLHTLCEVESCLQSLPRNDAPLRVVAQIQRIVDEAEPRKLAQADLHAFIDTLQLQLGVLNEQITAAYFSLASAAPADRAHSAHERDNAPRPQLPVPLSTGDA